MQQVSTRFNQPAPAARPILAVLMLAAILPAAARADDGLPDRFHRTSIAANLVEPTDCTIAPDGRIFIAERGGHVLLYIDGERRWRVRLNQVETNVGEGGLLGIAHDPQAHKNGRIYVAYTTRAGGELRTRVSSLITSDDGLDLSTEKIVLEVPAMQADGHYAGGLKSGPDGLLYLSCGDQWLAERSQDITLPQGKILRFRPDGTPPKDNPFYKGDGIAPYVWAYGFRNPFRFAFDPVGGALYAGDVGAAAWEELDRVRPGENYGWPRMEGPHCYVNDCSAFTPPIWSYPHDDPDQGQCIIMGGVYRSSAFPPEYYGNIFVADFTGGYIRRLDLLKGGTVEDLGVFTWGAPYVVDLEIGPDGALYYLSYVQGLVRIEHLDGSNRPPVPVVSASPLVGPPPLEVHFSSAGTHDPDGEAQELGYVWVFGDGQRGYESDPVHTYQQRGLYRARLIVDDGAYAALSDELEITVGAPPLVQLIQPPAGVLFRAGEQIAYEARGFDEFGEPLPESAYSARVLIMRPADAFNVLVGPLEGSNGVFTVPDSGRPMEDSHLRLEITVTDALGLTTTVSRELFPLVSPLSLDSEPSGVPIFLNDMPISTPHVYHGPVGYRYTLRAQDSYVLAGVELRFVGWSIGDVDAAEAELEVGLVAAEGGHRLVARYSRPDPAAERGRALDIPCFLFPLPAALLLLAAGRTRRSERRP